MKNLLTFLVFFFTFMFFFFLISSVGALWFPYADVITDPSWFAIYCTVFGWWMAGIVADEFYENLPE